DPGGNDSLESLILDLSRLATEEAQAAAARACVGVKLQADVQIAQARTTLQSEIERERQSVADFRRALEQAQDRIATVELEKTTQLDALHEQTDRRREAEIHALQERFDREKEAEVRGKEAEVRALRERFEERL